MSENQNSSAPDTKIVSAKEFKDSPIGWQKRWTSEMKASDRRVKRWHKQSHKIISRYQDRRSNTDSETLDSYDSQHDFRVNLFHSNVSTLKDMVYGNPPRMEVSRRYADPNDDVSRVASSILSRMLNNSVEDSGDDAKSALGYALDDRLLPGMGLSRVRYEYESEIEQVESLTNDMGEIIEEGYEQEIITDERAPIDYVHWDDFRWGWARTWAEVPWIAFRSYIKKDDAEKRFGEDVAKKLNYKNKSVNVVEEKRLDTDEMTDAWDRAEIWEIWHKESKRVFWFSYGVESILDVKDDPLRLSGFWPMPEPLLANCSTSLLLPQPDFVIAQDLYNQIDQLETRIGIITAAVRVVGVYDSAEAGIKRMLQEGMENDLIPVENWSAFSEGGQLDGKISWMPIGEIASVLSELTVQRRDAMGLLYEVTGMSEIMRGANGPDRETAEAAQGKRQFASVRVQSISEEFARFASDLFKLRAEVISKHFSKETILKQSNIMASSDAEIAPAACELIKDPKTMLWRVKVQPEALAMLDYQALKKDRMEFVQALAQFLQSAMPLAEMSPGAIGPLLEILKWTMAGFKGSNEIEGVLDKALDTFQKSQKEGGGKKEPSETELKMQQDAQKHQQAMELQNMKHQQALQLEQAKFQADMRQMMEEMKSQITVIREQRDADVDAEIAQAEAAMAQDDHESENAMMIDDNRAKNQRSNSE